MEKREDIETPGMPFTAHGRTLVEISYVLWDKVLSRHLLSPVDREKRELPQH